LIRLKIFVARILCSPIVGKLLAACFKDRIPSRGGRIDTANPAISARVKAQIFWGIYESAELRFIRRYLRSDLDCLELGGSLGVTGSAILRQLSPRVRLICVEANGVLLSTLHANLAQVAPIERWRVIHGAISATGKPTAFRRRETYGSHVVDQPGVDTETVPGIRLADLLDQQGLEAYTLVCDIEGGEASFLAHRDDSLRSCQQVIIELHDPPPGQVGPSGPDLRRQLVEVHGFRIVAERGNVICCEKA
jgi:FkbM family methyltransferase